jgi:uncharacterized SAM-binding protein YcdF (DUF218 family)
LPSSPTPHPLRRQAPSRPSRRRPVYKRRQPNWRLRLVLAAIVLIVGTVAWAIIARALAPTSNTARSHFDTLIVLGTPADSEGYPTPDLLARVTEGVREYERGVAPRLIFTGGPAHNRFVEAQVMASAAEALGVPQSAIFVEPQAKDTIQNACFADRIARDHGWTSAEVISSAAHLPRAALIFNRLPLQWRTHAVPVLTPESTQPSSATVMETLKTVRYLVYANWAERCSP